MPKVIQLPILGPGIAGRSLAVSAQERRNLYLEAKGEKDKTNLAAYGTPGLLPFADLGQYPIRGIWWMQAQNLIYAVSRDILYEVRGNGTAIERGFLLTTEGPVSMADNGIQLMLVDGANGYIFQPETADLAYSRTATTVTVTETLHTRVNGQSVEIQGDNAIPSGTYTIAVPPVAAGSLVTSSEYVITEVGTSSFTLVGAALNAVGIVFTATGTTAGTGTCVLANQWQFTTATSGTDSGDLKVINNFRNITAAYTGVTFPGATTVAFLDSYFVISVPDTKQFWLSASYDGFNWNPLQYASKETYTDNLSAVAVDNGNLVLLGEMSYEYWQNSGGYPFPLVRISGSPNDTGLAARFSVANVAGELMFLSRTRRGGLSVVMIRNYEAVPVSPPDLDYLLAQYQNPGDAVAFGYRQNGHDFYEISFQTEGKTWLYDLQTDAWSVLSSGTDTRHYASRGTQYYNRMVVGDYRNGKLHILDPVTYTDDGDSIIRELITPHFFAPSSFDKLHIFRLRLDMQQGVGLVDGQGDNPQIMLQVSRDGGYTYANELWTAFGAMGEFTRRAEWRRLGISRSFVFKFRISDPVPVVIISASAMATKADK